MYTGTLSTVIVIRWTTDWPTFSSPGDPVPQYLPTVGRLRDEHTGKTDNKTSKLRPQKVQQISLCTILDHSSYIVVGGKFSLFILSNRCGSNRKSGKDLLSAVR